MNLAFRDEVTTSIFRPTPDAIEFERKLDGRLGGNRPRYENIRLMIGRSLLEADSPPHLSNDQRASKGELRGRELFGKEIDLWMTLFILEGGLKEGSRIDDFRVTVEAHWSRGCQLLREDLEQAGDDVVQLAMNLANRLPDGVSTRTRGGRGGDEDDLDTVGPIRLQIGPVSQTHPGGEPISFVLNAGGSPHLVLMGKTGQGKTRIGVHIIRQILHATQVPFIYVDPKPDFAPGGQYHGTFDQNAENVTTLVVGLDPIPLDFLPRPDRGDIGLQSACMRLRDSICASAPAAGPVQRDRLLSCIEQVARSTGERGLESVHATYESALEDANSRADSVSSLLGELTRFDAFEPTLAPAEFFARSWVLSLKADIPDSYKNLIVGLLLDAAADYLLGQEDAPLINGHRELRHMLIIDEANRILRKSRSDSLVRLITQSRSRGCCLMLLSQNPGDFEGAEYDFLSQIGTVIAFACNQTDRGLTALKGVYGRRLMPNEFSDSRLTQGLAFCKLPQRDAEVVRCW